MGQQLRAVRRSFNGGEIGEQLWRRSELDPYNKSCISLQNCIPTPYGTALMRNGQVMGGYDPLSYNQPAGREFPFEYSAEVAYRILLTPAGKMYVFNIGDVFVPPAALPADFVFDSGDERVHSYSAEELREIWFFQSGDVIFLFHERHPTMRIERHADEDWRIVEHQYIGGPMMQDPPAERSIIESYEYATGGLEYVQQTKTKYDPESSTGEFSPIFLDEGAGLPPNLNYIETRIYGAELKITIGAHNIVRGDQVVISGMSNGDHDWDGEHTVLNTGADWITIPAERENIQTLDVTPEVYQEETKEEWFDDDEGGYWESYTDWEQIQSYSEEMLSSIYNHDYSLTELSGNVTKVVSVASSQEAGHVNIVLRPRIFGQDGPDYKRGDVVVRQSEVIKQIGGFSRVFWRKEQKNITSSIWHYYYLKIAVGSHGFKEGDVVWISGVGSPYDGTQTVLKIDGDSIYIDSRMSHRFRASGAFHERHFNGVKLIDTNGYGPEPDINAAPPALPAHNAQTKVRKSAWHTDDIFMNIQDATDSNALPAESPGVNTYWRSAPVVSGTVIAETTSGVFSAADTGRLIRVLRPAPTLKGIFTGPDAQGEYSAAIPCSGDITLTTREGVWAGVIVLQESTDYGETWTDRGKIQALDGDYNGTITRSATSVKSIWRVWMREYETGPVQVDKNPTGCRYVLEPVESLSYVYGTIHQVISPMQVTVMLETPMTENITTTEFVLGITGGARGYPSFGFIHDERLVIGGIPGNPRYVYCSLTNDWRRFDYGQLATSPFSFTFPGNKAELVEWGVSLGYMVFGTLSGEWSVKPRDAAKGYSFDNLKIEEISAIGSAAIQPVVHKDTIFFFGNDRKTIWAMAYEYEKDGLYSKQVDILAPHLPVAPAVMMCTTSTPWPVIWVLDAAGGLYSLVYDITNNVIAWSRHTFTYSGFAAATLRSIISVKKNGVSVLGLLQSSRNIGSGCYEIRLEGDSQLHRDYFFSATAQPLHSKIAVEIRPTFLTQDEEGLNGGSVWKTAAMDLFTIDTEKVEVWISGMDEDEWRPVPITGSRTRAALEASCTEDFDLVLRNGTEDHHWELAAFVLNFERTNSEVV